MQSAFADPNDGVVLPQEYFARLCDIALAAPTAPEPMRDPSAMEVAARICDALAAEKQLLIDAGKGEWPKPGYVRDETWSKWHGALYAYKEAANTIRRAMVKP